MIDLPKHMPIASCEIPPTLPVQVTAAPGGGLVGCGPLSGMVDRGPLTPAVTRRKPPSGSGLGRSFDQGLRAPSLGTVNPTSQNSGDSAVTQGMLQVTMEECP